MIRPFDWRDVRLVKRLGVQGLCLDAQTSLIRGHRPLQTALLEYLMPGAGASTLVWRDDDRAAFGQLRHRPGEPLARVLFVAPAEPGENWAPVVEHLAQQAGAAGLHHLIAEVDESSPAFLALRAIGFAVYTRQSVWRLNPDPQADPPASPLPLRPATSTDAFGVNTLYANVVPRLVLQVEPPPAVPRGLVLEQSGQVLAYLHAHAGPLGVWVEPCLHPEAEALSPDSLRSGLASLAQPPGRPVYVCVRRYQDWLQAVLERAGCVSLGAQAVLVKRLTVRVSEPALKPLPAIEGQTSPTSLTGARSTRGGEGSARYAKANHR